MDVEEIEFSDWQIDKIRFALNKYRVLSARNKRLPSWRQVRDNIAFSDSNIEKYEADDKELEFAEEALRRFAAEISVLGLERLRDVARFLFDEGMLEEEDLDEDKSDLADFLSMHRFLSANSNTPQRFINSLAGTWVIASSRVTKDGDSRIYILRFIPDPSSLFARVEEIEHVERPNDEARVDTTRIGYGLVATAENSLHVFLKGAADNDRVTYVQLSEFMHAPDQAEVILMRNGKQISRMKLNFAAYAQEPVAMPNVFRFIPMRESNVVRIG